MSIFEDMRSVLDTGLKGSRKAWDTARERVRQLGDESVTSLDIRQLRSERDRIVQELGRTVLDSFSSGERKSISPKTPGIKEIIEELEQLDRAIEEKEAALNALKNERRGGPEGEQRGPE